MLSCGKSSCKRVLVNDVCNVFCGDFNHEQSVIGNWPLSPTSILIPGIAVVADSRKTWYRSAGGVDGFSILGSFGLLKACCSADFTLASATSSLADSTTIPPSTHDGLDSSISQDILWNFSIHSATTSPCDSADNGDCHIK